MVKSDMFEILKQREQILRASKKIRKQDICPTKSKKNNTDDDSNLDGSDMSEY